MKAFFVKTPRNIEELTSIHLYDQENPYKIVEHIKLNKTDYENFVTDMRVQRQYIKYNFNLRIVNDTFYCLLIQQAKRNDGILIIPDKVCYIKWAAYIIETEE